MGSWRGLKAYQLVFLAHQSHESWDQNWPFKIFFRRSLAAERLARVIHCLVSSIIVERRNLRLGQNLLGTCSMWRKEGYGSDLSNIYMHGHRFINIEARKGSAVRSAFFYLAQRRVYYSKQTMLLTTWDLAMPNMTNLFTFCTIHLISQN